MTASVALIVLFAAFLHAFWNAVVKGAGDKTITLGMIALGHLLPGIVAASFAPLPHVSAWPYLAASVVIHWIYFYLLNVAYRTGDLSIIYPISRGMAPVLVALGAQFWVGETLSIYAWAGIFCVSLGIMALSRGVLQGTLPKEGLWAALGVGMIVATYTLVDGVGVRNSGNPLSYIGWLFVAKIAIVLYVFPTRMHRVRQMSRSVLMVGFFGGLVSGCAYALVLYAKSIAPLGMVSALRETSVIFAALIGVLWFGEGPRGVRIAAASIVGVGIIFIGVSK